MPVERYPLTPEHIAQGIKGDCTGCPVWLCLMPVLGALRVEDWHVLYRDDALDGPRVLYATPALAQEIDRFDHGHGMQPGTIIINREHEWADYEPEESTDAG
jgi:hypothetical protein